MSGGGTAIPIGIAKFLLDRGDLQDGGREVAAVKLFVQKCLCFCGQISHAADHTDLLAAALLLGVGFTDGNEFMRIGNGEAADRNDTFEVLGGAVGTGQRQGDQTRGAALEVCVFCGDVNGNARILQDQIAVIIVVFCFQSRFDRFVFLALCRQTVVIELFGLLFCLFFYNLKICYLQTLLLFSRLQRRRLRFLIKTNLIFARKECRYVK